MFVLNECLEKFNGIREVDKFTVLNPFVKPTPTKFTLTCLSNLTYKKMKAVRTSLKHSLFDIILKLSISRN